MMNSKYCQNYYNWRFLDIFCSELRGLWALSFAELKCNLRDTLKDIVVFVFVIFSVVETFSAMCGSGVSCDRVEENDEKIGNCITKNLR